MPVEDAPKPPPRRLTLTLPPLVAAERVVFAALGKAKAGMLCEALEQPGSPVVFLLDPEAASGLSAGLISAS